jgi:hypothetical protein
MDMTQVKITKAGKAVEGDLKPGLYYRVDVPEGTDIAAAVKELKKKFPKSFFVFRAAGPKPEAKNVEPKSAKDSKK